MVGSRSGYGAAMPEIGLVGLGRMGLPICASLVRAGYRVLAGDRRPEAARHAAGCGARWVPEVGRLAAGADILITVLPGPGEVRELMLGTGGAAAALRPGTTWIDMTSNSPAAVTEIRNALLDRGVQVLDAPAGGGVAAARQGSLQLLVGGQAEVVALHRELLEILGSPGRIRHVGGYGAGYTVKLLINLLWFGQAVATAEALLLGRASGLDLGVIREVLADSAAGSDFIRRDLDALFAGDFMRTFALDRCCEELQTVTELARDHHLPFQVSESVAELYRQALRRYGPTDGELLTGAGGRLSTARSPCRAGARRLPRSGRPGRRRVVRSAWLAEAGWRRWRRASGGRARPRAAWLAGVRLHRAAGPAALAGRRIR